MTYVVIRAAEGPGYVSAQELAGELVAKLKERGVPACLEHERKGVPQKPMLAVAVGGDGTVIRTASDYTSHQVPTIGLNAGDVGFLTAGEADELNSFVELIATRKYHVEHRMTIDAAYHSTNYGCFLNEVLLYHPSSIARFEVSINGLVVWRELLARGVMVATATGSTAQNVSNGGPIVMPDSDTFILTPMNPQTLNVRPIVGSFQKLGSYVSIKVIDSKHDTGLQFMGDGQELIAHETVYDHAQGVTKGNMVEISRGTHELLLATRGPEQFFTAMQEKKGFAR